VEHPANLGALILLLRRDGGHGGILA
jgi:hypothetical protein